LTQVPATVGIPAVAETAPPYGSTEQDVRTETAAWLRSHVAAMNANNFIVRPKRRLVEYYAQESSWSTLTEQQVAELTREVAGLPSEAIDDDEEAKRFDLLMLRLQLAVLHAEPGFDRLKEQVKSIVGALLDKGSIPMVREQMALIESVAGDEWWQDVTVPMLETARKRLRSLIKLIEKVQRKPVYTDFEDLMGAEISVALPEFDTDADRSRFIAKTRRFLKNHENHVAIGRLRHNQPLTASDLAELQRMMLDAGVGSPDDIARAKEQSSGLGLFIRSLVGLDRQAAKDAFGAFLSGGTATANQVEFVNLIVDHLTEHGVMDAELLYKSPFIDISPTGPEGVFSSAQVDQLVAVLADIRQRAA
jgi:type I restriction enzyme, R subunit